MADYLDKLECIRSYVIDLYTYRPSYLEGRISRCSDLCEEKHKLYIVCPDFLQSLEKEQPVELKISPELIGITELIHRKELLNAEIIMFIKDQVHNIWHNVRDNIRAYLTASELSDVFDVIIKIEFESIRVIHKKLQEMKQVYDDAENECNLAIAAYNRNFNPETDALRKEYNDQCTAAMAAYNNAYRNDAMTPYNSRFYNPFFFRINDIQFI